MSRRHLEMFIDSCGKCPWCDYTYHGHFEPDDYCCGHKNAAKDNRIISCDKFFRDKKWPEIPKWCPLPYENLA